MSGKRYSQEFRDEAVRLVVEGGHPIPNSAVSAEEQTIGRMKALFRRQ